MASRGSFSGGLNPFGSSKPSGLSAYSVGSSLAQLDAYKAAVGWQNGTVSNDDYIASLAKVLAAATPDSHDQVSAQNALDDAKYTIGRQAAQDKGLDNLIAFDQTTLTTMRPDNNHADDIKNTLASEYAQRRSRDYNTILDQVNAGQASEQSLLDWVTGTLSSLPANAPDADNWVSTSATLGRQIQGNKDSQVYQDYQYGKVSGADFLAYVQTRRDSYDPTSPDYQTWSNKLEDATKNVSDAKFAAQDTAFFDLYNQGQKSDTQYLAYIQSRLAGMDPSDNQYEEWRYRATTAAFSVAEDQLIFGVNHGTRSVNDLISFYQSYAAPMDHGSAEWRTIQDKIDNLRGSSSGGGGGSSGTSSQTPAGYGKIIGGQFTLDTVLPSLAPNPNASEADQKAELAAFNDNYGRLVDARTAGDHVWLYINPSNAGATVQGQNPDGSPMVDASGKPVMVRGQAYLPVTDKALANMDTSLASYHYTLAQIALTKGDNTTFFKETTLGDTSDSHARTVWNQGTQKDNQQRYDLAQQRIDLDLKTGNTEDAYNTIQSTRALIREDLTSNPNMDATRQKALTDTATKLGSNPIIPTGSGLVGPDGKELQGGGAIDAANSTWDNSTQPPTLVGAVLNPGWHKSLDSTNSTGTMGMSYVFSPMTDAQWQESHMTVTVPYGNTPATGDAEIKAAGASSTLYARVTINGADQIIPISDVTGTSTAAGGKDPMSMVQWIDQFGHEQTAYTLDGRTFIQPTDGQPPTLQFSSDIQLTRQQDPKTNGWIYVDQNGNTVLQQASPDGSWSVNPGYLTANPGAFQFLGLSSATSPWAGDSGAVGGPGTRAQIFITDGNGNLDATQAWKPYLTDIHNAQYADMVSATTPVATGSAAGSYNAQGQWTPTQTTVVQGVRYVQQPGASSQDVNLGKNTKSSSIVTPPPPVGLLTDSRLPKASAMPGVMSKPVPVLPPGTSWQTPGGKVTVPTPTPTPTPTAEPGPAPTLPTPPPVQTPVLPTAPLTDSRLPTVKITPPPVIQTTRQVTQPGQTGQDITPSKPRAPVAPVIQPKQTIKAV